LALLTGCQSLYDFHYGPSEENVRPLPRELRPELSVRHGYNYYLLISQDPEYWQESRIEDYILLEYNVDTSLRDMLLGARYHILSEPPTYSQYLLILEDYKQNKLL